MDEKEIDGLAKILWDYHYLNQAPKKADCILVLGSQDIRVAEKGAQLFLDGWAPLIVAAGSFGRFTGKWKKPEAEVFAKRMTKMGVPADKILVENKSTNTGENIRFSKKILDEKRIMARTVIAVHRPYMERRTMATFKIVWPQVKVFVVSPQVSFKEYPNKTIPKKRMINALVGNLQRIKIYPEKGLQAYQEIPVSVENAYEKLVQLGFSDSLVKEG